MAEFQLYDADCCMITLCLCLNKMSDGIEIDTVIKVALDIPMSG